MNEKVTVGALQQMKRDGRKIVGVVAWDYQIAAIADRAGVEIVSVGDSVGVNLWGHRSPLEVTLAEMIIVVPGGAPRGHQGTGQRGHPVRPRAGGHRQRRPGGGQARQGSGRGPRQDRRRGRLPRGRGRRDAGGHPGVGAARGHPADRAAARRRVRGDARPRRAGPRRHEGRAGRRRAPARGGGRRPARLHQLGAGRGPRGHAGGRHPGHRRCGRRPVARRAGPDGARCHRLRRADAGRQAGQLRARRPGHHGRADGGDRGRPGQAGPSRAISPPPANARAAAPGEDRPCRPP